MATKKSGEGGGRKGGDDGGYGDGAHRPEPYKEEAGALWVHQAYLEERLHGGEPPSPEALRRAELQFSRLPGAVRSVPPVVSRKNPNEKTAGKWEAPPQKGDGK